jgi:hypothetical protein
MARFDPFIGSQLFIWHLEASKLDRSERGGIQIWLRTALAGAEAWFLIQ